MFLIEMNMRERDVNTVLSFDFFFSLFCILY